MYRGMRCVGCGVAFARGERVCGGGDGFVHQARSCKQAAAKALQEAARLQRAEVAITTQRESGWPLAEVAADEAGAVNRSGDFDPRRI